MQSRRKNSCFINVWCTQACVQSLFAVTHTHTHPLWFIINGISHNTFIQLNVVCSSCTIHIYSVWCKNSCSIKHTENPQEIVNRCIEAPANTHSHKSLDKQPGENNSKSSHCHCSLPLVHLFHKWINHIALTQYPVAFLFPHLFLLTLFSFSTGFSNICIYLPALQSSPFTLQITPLFA